MYIKAHTQVGEYQVVLVLGEGRYSTVYKAQRVSDGEVVAIKCASKAETLFSKTYIENERKIVGMLMPHTNVARHLGLFEDKKCVYFVMEYLNGFTLRREITESFFSQDPPAISAQMKKSYLLQVIDGLKHLHSLDIYHCDMKPENIVIVGEVVKIVDFGCSVYSTENLVKFKKKCINSTPGYGPPETIAFESPGSQVLLEGVDVWALGCLIYFVFSGITPFAQKTSYETIKSVLSIDIKLDVLPCSVQDICKGIFVADIFQRLRLCEVEELVKTLIE